MAGIIEFKVKGFEQLYKELEELPRRIQKNALREACFEGAKVVKEIAIANVYRSKYDYYWSLAKEKNTSDYSNMQIRQGYTTKGWAGGKPGFSKQKFPKGWVAERIYIGRAKKRPLLTEIYRVFIHDDAWFGRFIEYGGGGLSKQPFLRPALFKNINNVMSVMRDTLRVYLNRLYERRSNKILTIDASKG